MSGYFTPLPDRGVISVSGPDAKDFLQRLISADIEKAKPDALLFGALLSPQGKYLFDFFILDIEPDEYRLDVAQERTAELVKKLSLYRLKAKVAIADLSGQYAVIAAWNAPLSLKGFLADPRLPAMGHRAMIDAAALSAIQASLADRGLLAASPDAYRAHRIYLSVPDAQYDLKIDGDFPLEGLFDELNGVDFKKGCFIGQETASRMKRRGITRTKIVAFNVEGDAIPPGTDIMAGDLRLGESKSSIAGRCLALVRLDRLAAADAPVTIAGRPALADVADWVILPPPKSDAPA